MEQETEELEQEEIETLLGNCYADPVLFAFTFLPSWYPVDDISQITWFQRGVLAVLCRKANFLLKYGELEKIIANFRYREEADGESFPMFTLQRDAAGEVYGVSLTVGRFTEIYMPRGYSKTTLINTATLYKILFRERKFIIYLSETATHAEMQLNAVKTELKVNKIILAVFGNLVPEQRQGYTWRDGMIQLPCGITVAAKGRGAQVRGMNDRGNRPDDIVLDDVEDKESVQTEAQRLKARTWFYGDVVPALPIADKSATITVVGTLLHDESLMRTLEKDNNFHTIKFGALDVNGEPLWPLYLDHASLEAKKQSFIRVGQLNSFMMEYMTTVRDEDSSLFKSQYLIIQPPTSPFDGIALAVDPAISSRSGADYFCIAVVGMQRSGLLNVLECWGKVGVTPREQVDKVFALFTRYKPTKVGIEAIAYQKALVHLVREEMFRKKTYFSISEISHGVTGKHERVTGVLQPRYAAGYIHHSRHFPELESQLLDWPNGKKDFPDAVAMAITLLDPYAAAAADPTKDLCADEYEPLDAHGWAS